MPRRFPAARVCHVRRALPGAARNLLVERARGELLLFLDDDVVIEAELLARLAKLADVHPEADVFGGPNDTPPQKHPVPVRSGCGAGVDRRLGAGAATLLRPPRRPRR
ncbi:hypothetical protein BH24ACT3_BH24ACT3_09110 [soil metagenome]